MANNRMFLLHRPTGRAVYLGKRMAWGWYDAPEDLGDRLQTLYDEIEEANENQDDFCIAMEDITDAPLCFGDWKYDKEEKPVRNLRI